MSSIALAQTNVGANLFASCSPGVATNRQQTRPSKSAERGFTLVELIMVIALAGIVAVMITTVMSRPLQGFADQSRRAELTDLAAMALNRMARDIRLAVPNSVRNELSCSPEVECRTLEMLEIREGGRYTGNLWETGEGRFDPPRCPDDSDCYIPVLSPGITADSVKWMVIYNTGQEIWQPSVSDGESIITPEGVEIGSCPSFEEGVDKCLKLEDAKGFSFASASQQNRFYLVDKAVGYQCRNVGEIGGQGGGELRRAEHGERSVDNYHPYTSSNSSLVVKYVSECSLSYRPGVNTRNGLVTLRLSLTKGGETITLLQQVHVDNAP